MTTHAFVLLCTNDPDEIGRPEVFTTAKGAAEKLVSYIDGYGLTDEAGEDLDMDDILAWTGEPHDFECWDNEGRIVYTLYKVDVDV